MDENVQAGECGNDLGGQSADISLARQIGAE